MERRCPDCDVAKWETEHKTTYDGDGLRIDTDGGILGNMLGLEGTYLGCHVCPACGLVRFSAE